MQIREDLFDLLKTIFIWAGVVALFYISPVSFHFRIGHDDGKGLLEVTIGKSENSIKVGTEY